MANCSICNAKDQFLIYNELLLKCPDCGFITANLDHEAVKVKDIYTDKYFRGDEYEDYIRDKSIAQNNFNRRISWLEKYIPPEKRRNILEIGCAFGFFGELISERWHSRYLGVDIVKEAIDYAIRQLKLNAIQADYLGINNIRNEYDTFIMFDVLEHLVDPSAIISKISGEISNGGYLVITTGDIGSLLGIIQGKKWRMIHPPSHLHYFNKKSIKLLLERNGFKVLNITHPGIMRSLKQIFYSLFILKKDPRFFTQRIYELIPAKWTLSVNTFDVMLVVAKKVS